MVHAKRRLHSSRLWRVRAVSGPGMQGCCSGAPGLPRACSGNSPTLAEKWPGASAELGSRVPITFRFWRILNSAIALLPIGEMEGNANSSKHKCSGFVETITPPSFPTSRLYLAFAPEHAITWHTAFTPLLALKSSVVETYTNIHQATHARGNRLHNLTRSDSPPSAANS